MVNNDFSTLAFSTYKQNLAGLPSFCRLVMLEAFEHYDQATGTIIITSLDKLARDNFQVDAARGRQKEDINGGSLRNAFRTIKKFKSDYFQFSTVNQQIVIDIPFLRELHQSILKETSEVAAILSTDLAADTTLAQHDESPVFDSIDAGDVAGVLAAASLDDPINAYDHAQAKINPTKFNNNKPVSDEFADLKKLIADDFFPSQFVIDKALDMGLSKVTDTAELTKFILFNKSTGSKWKNFDYVYLTWLIRDAEREQAKKAMAQQQKQKHSFNTASGRTNHGTHSNSEKSRATQRVIDAWSDELEFCPSTSRFKPRTTANHAPASVRYLDCNDLGPIN